MANSGRYPFVVSDPATPLQLFRVLTNDSEPVPTDDSAVGTYKFLSDAEATALLSLYADNPRLAAAREFETIAVSEALLRKFVSDDQSLDGPAVATALRQLAAQMRAEVVAGAALEDDFEIVDTGTDPWYGKVELIPDYPYSPYYSGL